ncbi:hypothetical protein K490DRAFT_74267 [Saccharata proteae CBS 121410]|uniref:polynucleotide adenylyltransferase n=1 Tax=Saccharata proteae CBS 121410 TaxID=1314787 RepID=A0A9P4LWM4_9PEZI|nr:hypothetical protein K490DRAFT_74267 [Saccharata proteae CBS 121410]
MSSYRPSYGDPGGYGRGDAHSRRRSPRRASPPTNYQFGGGDSYRPGNNAREFGRQNNRQNGRPAWRPPPAPHSRPILATNREKTPEQFLGMTESQSRFLPLEDVSDSEAEMDLESNDGDEKELPPAKRARVDNGDGDAVPKWSNPDPYTSLPPPDESQTKKKDVVKLIRKAKVAPQQEAESNSISQGADFISLNFDDDEKSSSESPSEDELDANAAPPRFSHLKNLHTDISSLPAKPPVPLPDPQAFTGPSSLPSSSLDVWPPQHPSEPQPSMPSQGPGNGKKRNFDQTADDLPPLSKKRKRPGPAIADGNIIPDWEMDDYHTSTPWCTVDHSATENIGFWLHKEICDFYDFVKPQPAEEVIRRQLVDRLQNVINEKYKGKVFCFGSFAAGLYLPTADMDLVFMTPAYQNGGPPNFTHYQLMQLGQHLRKHRSVRQGSVEVISKAKVPIIKLVDDLTGLKVDISFDNDTGVRAIDTFKQWKRDYPALPVIATLVKHFLAMRGLNEVFSGGLGGFSVICMVVSMIHHLPARLSNNVAPEHHLGELLMNFLDLYGNKFNIAHTRISLNPQRYVSKPDRLSIIDPNNNINDLSQGSRRIVLIQQCFSQAYDKLQKEMGRLHRADLSERRNKSILSTIFAGDYSSFSVQRERLKNIYDYQQGL